MNDAFAKIISMLMMSNMLNALESIRREVIRDQLVEKLGRQPTWYDWLVYEQEEAARQRLQAQTIQIEQARASWNALMGQLQQVAVDRQKIRDFVWQGR